ncbi:hypothetical protein GCM10022291_01390 [Postechiella marina]|uniref:DUF2946 domain-containing protein n=1 Tax=Postechiella marina TaxID=943941 RepID=A0ABP8BZ41_9FLAO
MKLYLLKISSILFLTIILLSKVVNLHAYSHNQAQELSHCQNNDLDNDHNQNKEGVPCDLCLLVINLNNLDYNNSLEFSFKSTPITEIDIKENVLNYINLIPQKSYLNKQKNKAPPYTA